MAVLGGSPRGVRGITSGAVRAQTWLAPCKESALLTVLFHPSMIVYLYFSSQQALSGCHKCFG